MIALLQRVTQAQVSVDGTVIGRIGMGLMVLVGVQRGDGETESARLLERLLSYRIFADEAGRMNRSVLDVQGGLLLVPQFTLAADTRSGTRPGFTTAHPLKRAAAGSSTSCPRPAANRCRSKPDNSARTCRSVSPTTDPSRSGWKCVPQPSPEPPIAYSGEASPSPRTRNSVTLAAAGTQSVTRKKALTAGAANANPCTRSPCRVGV